MASEFGRGSVFMDVDSIPAGADFVRHLDKQVAHCDILLAIIGPNWLDSRDATGAQRIRDSNDFVMTEIVAALNREIRVIPVLVDGAAMPKAEELPESLRPLVRRNAVEVRNTQFHADAGRLIDKIREGETTPRLLFPLRWAIAVFGTVLAMSAVGLIYHFAIEPNSRKMPAGFAASDFRIVDRTKPPLCDFGAPPEPVPIISGGLANLALLKQTRVLASSLIPGFPLRHQVNNLVDGWYSNCRSWIPAVLPAWAEVDLGEVFRLSSVKLGSEHTTFSGDRAPSAFTIGIRAEPSSNWTVMYKQELGQDPIHGTTEFRFPSSREAQYVRVDITATKDGDLPRLDEVEIYGARR